MQGTVTCIALYDSITMAMTVRVKVLQASQSESSMLSSEHWFKKIPNCSLKTNTDLQLTHILLWRGGGQKRDELVLWWQLAEGDSCSDGLQTPTCNRCVEKSKYSIGERCDIMVGWKWQELGGMQIVCVCTCIHERLCVRSVCLPYFLHIIIFKLSFSIWPKGKKNSFLPPGNVPKLVSLCMCVSV